VPCRIQVIFQERNGGGYRNMSIRYGRRMGNTKIKGGSEEREKEGLDWGGFATRQPPFIYP